jgi:hypothetical protein
VPAVQPRGHRRLRIRVRPRFRPRTIPGGPDANGGSPPSRLPRWHLAAPRDWRPASPGRPYPISLGSRDRTSGRSCFGTCSSRSAGVRSGTASALSSFRFRDARLDMLEHIRHAFLPLGSTYVFFSVLGWPCRQDGTFGRAFPCARRTCAAAQVLQCRCPVRGWTYVFFPVRGWPFRQCSIFFFPSLPPCPAQDRATELAFPPMRADVGIALRPEMTVPAELNPGHRQPRGALR